MVVVKKTPSPACSPTKTVTKQSDLTDSKKVETSENAASDGSPVPEPTEICQSKPVAEATENEQVSSWTLKAAEETSKAQKILCYSRALVETFTHTWKIGEFDEIPFVSRYPISSPSFTLGDSLYQVVLTKHKYYKRMVDNKPYSYEDEGDSSEESDLSLCDSKSFDEKVVIHDCGKTTVKVAKAGSDFDNGKRTRGSRLGLRITKMEDNNTWDVVKYYFVLKSGDLEFKTGAREEPGDSEYESETSYVYLTSDDPKVDELWSKKEVQVECHITYSYIEGNSQEVPKVFHGKKFADDLKLLFKSKKFSDVSLKVRGGEVLLAHKNVLCARAKGFEKLLTGLEKPAPVEGEAEEESSKFAKFDLKLDPEVGKMMVDFIYGNEIKDFPAIKCIPLHAAATSYGVTNLRRSCSDYFRRHLEDNQLCKVCLGIFDHTDDCIEVVRALDIDEVKKVLEKEKCSHV